MTAEKFNEIIHEQISRCEATLCKKADEYATEDRLHNFKQAAALQKCKPETALAGMMCKHTVSVYDMLKGVENGKEYPIEMWDEKIGDNINYLLLLSAMVREKSEKTEEKRALYLSREYDERMRHRMSALAKQV